MDCKVFIVIVLIYNEFICTNAEWQTPFFEVAKDKRIELVELNEKEVILRFEENVEDKEFSLGRLLLDDAAEPQLINSNNFFKLSGFNFVSTTALNYEAEDQKKLEYKILDITEMRIITIHVKNLNDEPVYVEQSGTCSLNELETPDKLNCDFTVLDADGLMDQMDITELSPYTENFEFYWRDGVPDPDITNAKIDIRTKLAFDYQNTKIVIFDWTVKDERYSAKTKVVVNIEDIPNRPPLWETIINSAQFNEKEKQEFIIKAIDGDYGINDIITYKWNIITPELKKYIQFNPDANGNLAINVDGIDRDEFQVDTYKFQVTACETVMPEECIDNQIVFMVNDINDQVPEMTISKEKLLIKENTYERLDTAINIYDKDLGENAKYTVILESAIPNINDIFQIVPNSGYQQGEFSISVLTKEALDFDRLPNMRKFKFDILATETILTNPHAPTKKTIEIELINWNDEIPVFSKESYEIKIKETFGREKEEILPIEDLYATDADIDDCVTYKLVGEAIKRILQFDGKVEKCEPGAPSTPITIKTKKAVSNAMQLFDFETQPEVIVQLEAQDNFKGNTVVPNKIIAPIVIKLIDVNDETPVILNNQPVITIKEGQPDGTEIPDIDIIASDDDEHAILKFGINWEKSYIAKNGQINRDWGTYENCIRIETSSIPNSKDKRAKLFITETVIDNTPDFETFDTMYLYIIVTDDGQEFGNPSSEVSLVISIENVNDVPPKFVVSTLTEKIVKDKAATDTLIGIITATDNDADVSEPIEYSIEERNATSPDLLRIDSRSGELFVKKDKGIDADVPTYYLYYNVYAFDGLHTTKEQFTVKIDDVNDRYPEFIEDLVNKKIPEGPESIGAPVLNIIAEDKDREKPHNIISYNIKGENVKEFFEVSESGEITVKSDKLDRDEGQAEFDVTVELRDNKGNADGESLLSTSNFKITITDVNNKKPEVVTKNLKTEEYILQGGTIGEIKAQDKDDPTTDNAKIDFELLEVNTISGKEMDKNLLNLDEYNPNTGIATLKTNTPLRGYHGSYNIKIKVTDKGANKLTSTGDVTLNVDKFNFEIPKFIFPKAGQTLYIKPGQELDKPLVMFNSKPLDSISATDQQGDKYNIDFAVTDENSIFKVDNMVGSINSGTLKLTSREDTTKKYEVHVIAKDDGQPNHNSTINFFVRFIDDTTKPAYEDPTHNIEFEEGNISLEKEFTTPKATLNLEGEIENLFPIYYNIFDDPNEAFSINSETGVLKLTKEFNIVDKPKLYIKIAASTYESGELNPEPQSLLEVIIKLIDVNTHTPQFLQEIYYGAIMSTYDQQRVIVSTNADDLDPTDVLTYSIIEDSIEVHGEEISKNNKFDLSKVDNTQCDIKLGFQVQTNMKGYFTFKMLVDDSLHTNTALIKINIIQEKNLVKFIFENTVNEVNDKQKIIVQVFTEYLELDCVIDSIVESTAETKIETKTDVVVHFITEDNEPLDNNEIQIMMNDEAMNLNIRSALKSEGLFLYTIDNKKEIDDNSEEVLKAWLIGVTVVLGSICVLLIVAFILKTRSLNKRLNKLTVVECVSQEDLSKITAAPTTNRRAIDGANPIYNNNSDETKMPASDRMSVSSGESDLIGVENNPVFY